VQKIWFENGCGVVVGFDDSPPYILWTGTGFGLPETFATGSSAAGQHGYTLDVLVLKARTVTVTGHVRGASGDTGLYKLRRELSSALDPALGGGRLFYQNDTGVWWARAFAKKSSYGEKIPGLQTVEFTFECPSPYFLSESKETVDLAYAEGGLSFPMLFPAYFGTLGYRAEIFNDGGPTPVELTISGGAVNPAVTSLTTGQKIRVGRGFGERDKLYINTDTENVRIQRVSVNIATNEPEYENAFGCLTGDSELFWLRPGRNEIVFTSDDEGRAATVKLEYYKRYAGV